MAARFVLPTAGALPPLRTALLSGLGLPLTPGPPAACVAAPVDPVRQDRALSFMPECVGSLRVQFRSGGTAGAPWNRDSALGSFAGLSRAVKNGEGGRAIGRGGGCVDALASRVEPVGSVRLGAEASGALEGA